jgi:hypothetical protein
MGVIVALLYHVALTIWCLRRWQDAHSPMPPLKLTESTADAPKQMGWAALTEDDVILFGLALEASNDVISDLLADSC